MNTTREYTSAEIGGVTAAVVTAIVSIVTGIFAIIYKNCTDQNIRKKVKAAKNIIKRGKRLQDEIKQLKETIRQLTAEAQTEPKISHSISHQDSLNLISFDDNLADCFSDLEHCFSDVSDDDSEIYLPIKRRSTV
jgi:sensor domain CHASE-containing protein